MLVAEQKVLMNAKQGNRLSYVVLWLFVFAGTVAVAYRRYLMFKGVVPTSPSGQGGDFWGYLHAARQISAGHNPYNFAQIRQGYGYVYSPLVALVLVPFHFAATENVWHVWIVLSIAALVFAGGLVTMTETSQLRAWRRPVFFGITSITALEFVPTLSNLSNGQTDTFVLALLAAAVLLSKRGWKGTSGVFIGLGAVIKTWPAGAALILLRRGYVGRRRTFLGLVATLLLAPLLALVVGGASGLSDFIKVTIDARSQQLLSYSVWGAPKLLFSKSGLAHPWFVSRPLRDAATFVLVVWVIGLVVLVLRQEESSVLSFWNVFACVVLFLPVSHPDYTLYLLPILWIWIARWLYAPRLRGLTFAMCCLMALWWLVLFHSYWSGGTSASSVHFVVPFAANFAAVTGSVIADHVREPDVPASPYAIASIAKSSDT